VEGHRTKLAVALTLAHDPATLLNDVRDLDVRVIVRRGDDDDLLHEKDELPSREVVEARLGLVEDTAAVGLEALVQDALEGAEDAALACLWDMLENGARVLDPAEWCIARKGALEVVLKHVPGIGSATSWHGCGGKDVVRVG
jgi:hypothetical protein